MDGLISLCNDEIGENFTIVCSYNRPNKQYCAKVKSGDGFIFYENGDSSEEAIDSLIFRLKAYFAAIKYEI